MNKELSFGQNEDVILNGYSIEGRVVTMDITVRDYNEEGELIRCSEHPFYIKYPEVVEYMSIDEIISELQENIIEDINLTI